jgi:cell division protein FtsB
MRWLPAGLMALILLLQYPLWLGKGGWLKVWEMKKELVAEYARHRELASRNDALYAEVQDLKQGLDAVEERARSDLGMIRQDEIFFQLAPFKREPGPADDQRIEASPQ